MTRRHNQNIQNTKYRNTLKEDRQLFDVRLTFGTLCDIYAMKKMGKLRRQVPLLALPSVSVSSSFTFLAGKCAHLEYDVMCVDFVVSAFAFNGCTWKKHRRSDVLRFLGVFFFFVCILVVLDTGVVYVLCDDNVYEIARFYVSAMRIAIWSLDLVREMWRGNDYFHSFILYICLHAPKVKWDKFEICISADIGPGFMRERCFTVLLAVWQVTWGITFVFKMLIAKLFFFGIFLNSFYFRAIWLIMLWFLSI